MWIEQYKNSINYNEIKSAILGQENLWNRNWSIDYKKLIETLPDSEVQLLVDGPKVNLQGKNNSKVEEVCNSLKPWKKGPFNVLGTEIDSEWRSDLKWNRIEKSLGDLKGKKVLDIGCNNGYFMFKMAKFDPEFVLGIDPVMHCGAQFHFLNKLAKQKNLFFEFLGIQHVCHFQKLFDVILSMGILYHHRNPIQQLLDMKNALSDKGKLVLETITIPGEGSHCLFPEDRYAQMPNVWFVPTTECLINWLKRTKFKNIKLVHETKLTSEEQRKTDWSGNKSLEDFLDRDNQSLTIEGHPAPNRVVITATKN